MTFTCHRLDNASALWRDTFAQVQCLKILSIKEPNAAPALLAPEDDSKTFINPSETSNSSKNRSQVTTGNAYEGFFEQDPVASAAAPLGFVTAANMRQAAPDASAFLAAAARPPPDPSTLPYIDFGSGPCSTRHFRIARQYNQALECRRGELC